MDTLKEMNTQTLFKKVILRDNVSERIEEAYKALSEAIQLCEVSCMNTVITAARSRTCRADWDVDRYASCHARTRGRSPNRP